MATMTNYDYFSCDVQHMFHFVWTGLIKYFPLTTLVRIISFLNYNLIFTFILKIQHILFDISWTFLDNFTYFRERKEEPLKHSFM